MRLTLGHVEGFDDTIASFAKQLGLTSIQFHTPSDLSGEGGVWIVAELVALRERCEEHGLVVEGLENVPYRHWNKVLRGLPGRDEQLENYATTIRNMAEAGITMLGHHFMPTYVWRTNLQGRGRGGARVTAYDERVADRGNALAGYKLAPDEAFDEPIDVETMWDNYRVFLEAVLPVAENAGVRLALHPDDPPTTEPVGGIARIMSSPSGLRRAQELSNGSPAWGMDLCLGTVSEMAGQRSVDELIDYFGPQGKIFYVHMRDVDGTVPKFDETFLGAGNYDPPRVIRHLADVGFDGFIIDDHVPAMIGDDDTWADTASAAYCSRGRANAIGYLQGVFDAVLGRERAAAAQPRVGARARG
jgi:mannonate dehydratase